MAFNFPTPCTAAIKLVDRNIGKHSVNGMLSASCDDPGMIVIGQQPPCEPGDPLQLVQTLDVATTKESLKFL